MGRLFASRFFWVFLDKVLGSVKMVNVNIVDA